ncbi:MAG: Protease HtpX [Verrucomicrobiota bacterium]|jgi:Zn-dependent protease with chaperone function
MKTHPHPEADQRSDSPLDAFGGTIAPTRTGPLYTAGLAVVAFAMVLLPLIYLALIGVTVWAVVLHLINDTWLFNQRSGRGGFIALLLYLGPALAGGILVFFMVKPFFATHAAPAKPITLDPKAEPLLFAFVQRICALVGSPVPCRIDVDCQVNASAGLRRGLWSRDLVLTIGLPLASGLDMRQFAGVLAHEFGHFAQGAGMRLTYVIRQINFWFARVVFERDAWDVRLEQTARNTDLRLGVILHTARGCVWLTRRILWALMQAGHAISCFMLRQMEYDADSYEAKLAGSDAFESTAARLRVLNVATQVAYDDLRQCWAGNRLPENFPLLIEHKAESLSAEVHQKISASKVSEKTAWFDTHPCDADRIREAGRLGEPGIFNRAEPAALLFSDFAELSRKVTRHHYETQLELEFSEQNLMSSEEILRESAASSEADSMIRKFYGTVNISLHPLLTPGELPGIGDFPGALTSWRSAWDLTESLRAEAEASSVECLNQQERLPDLHSAQRLAQAGFKLELKEFGLPEGPTSPSEQEEAARSAMDAATTAMLDQLTRLDPFFTALRQRVTLALRLAPAPKAPLTAEEDGDVGGRARLLAAVTAEMPQVREISFRLPAFLLLAQNRGNSSSPSTVESALAEMAAELQALIQGIQERLSPYTYPFPHARGRLTVAEYAKHEKAAESEWQLVYLDGNAHVDRLFALHYRLVGRILAEAGAAEASFEAR